MVMTFSFSNFGFAVTQDDIKAAAIEEAERAVTSELSIDDIGIAIDSGTVKTRYKGENGKVIIHIQDAHCNYEAQQNIYRMLDQLVRECGISMISVEGAEGVVDTSWFKAFPDAEIRKEVATYFMKKGEITGAEFFSIISDYKGLIFGAEDREDYVTNLKVFTKTYPYKSIIENFFLDARTVTNSLKGMIYPPKLKELDLKIREFEDKEIELSDFASYLNECLKKNNISVKEYPNFGKLVNTLEYERKIDFDTVDQERSMYIDVLSEKMSKEEMTDLVTYSIRFKKGHIRAVDFYSHLRDKAKEHNIDMLKDFPSLFYYYIYTKLYEGIDNEGLFKEMDKIESVLKDKMFTDDTQRTLDKYSVIIDMYIGLVNIELTNDDYDLFKEDNGEGSLDEIINFLGGLCSKYGLNYSIDTVPAAISENIPNMVKFYEVAMKRDHTLINNTLQEMDKGDEKISVLITGGFHTKGIKHILEKEGVSYVVVMPKITKDVETPYIQVLTNQRTSLEDIFTESAIPATASEMAGASKEPVRSEGEMLAPVIRIGFSIPLLIGDPAQKTELAKWSEEIGAVPGAETLEESAETALDGIVGEFTRLWLDKVKGTMQKQLGPEKGPEEWNRFIDDDILWDMLRSAYLGKYAEAGIGIPDLIEQLIMRKFDEFRTKEEETRSPGTEAVREEELSLTSIEAEAMNEAIKATIEAGKYEEVPDPLGLGTFVVLDDKTYEENARKYNAPLDVECHPGTRRTRDLFERDEITYDQVDKRFYLRKSLYDNLSDNEKEVFARHEEMHIQIALGLKNVPRDMREEDFVNTQPGCDVRPIMADKFDSVPHMERLLAKYGDTATDYIKEQRVEIRRLEDRGTERALDEAGRLKDELDQWVRDNYKERKELAEVSTGVTPENLAADRDYWLNYRDPLELANERFRMLTDLVLYNLSLSPSGSTRGGPVLAFEDKIKAENERHRRGISPEAVAVFRVPGYPYPIRLTAEQVRLGWESKELDIIIRGSVISGDTVLLPGSNVVDSVVNDSQGKIVAKQSYIESSTAPEIDAHKSIVLGAIDKKPIRFRRRVVIDSFRPKIRDARFPEGQTRSVLPLDFDLETQGEIYSGSDRYSPQGIRSLPFDRPGIESLETRIRIETFQHMITRQKYLAGVMPLELTAEGAKGPVVEMTDMETYINTRAFIEYLKETGGLAKGRDIVYVGGDLRPSSPRIMSTVAQAITDSGYDVIFFGFVPSSALANETYVNDKPSVMVTGSEAPAEITGLEFMKKKGESLTVKEVSAIKENIVKIRGEEYAKSWKKSRFDEASMFKAGQKREYAMADLVKYQNLAEEEYWEALRKMFPGQPLKGKKIVFYEHSVTGRDLIKKIFEWLGAEVITIGRSEEFVSIEEIPQAILEEARKHEPFAIISTNADATRPFLVNENGEVVPGEQIAALAAVFLEPSFAAVPAVINEAVIGVLESHGIKVVQTPSDIASQMKAIRDYVDTEPKASAINIEQGGGILIGNEGPGLGGRPLPVIPHWDAVVSLVSAISLAAQEGKSMSQLTKETFPPRYRHAGVFTEFKPLFNKEGEEAIALMRERMKDFSYSYPVTGIRAFDFETNMVTTLKPDTFEVRWERAHTMIEPADSDMWKGWFTIKENLEKIFKAEGLPEIKAIDILEGLKITFMNGEVVHLMPSETAPEFRYSAIAETPERAVKLVEIGVMRVIPNILGVGRVVREIRTPGLAAVRKVPEAGAPEESLVNAVLESKPVYIRAEQGPRLAEFVPEEMLGREFVNTFGNVFPGIEKIEEANIPRGLELSRITLEENAESAVPEVPGFHRLAVVNGAAEVIINGERYQIPGTAAGAEIMVIPATVKEYRIVAADEGAEIIDIYAAIPEKYYAGIYEQGEKIPGVDVPKYTKSMVIEDYGEVSEEVEIIQINNHEVSPPEIIGERPHEIIIQQGELGITHPVTGKPLPGPDGTPAVFTKGDILTVTKKGIKSKVTGEEFSFLQIELAVDYKLVRRSEEPVIVKISYEKADYEEPVYAVYEAVMKHMPTIVGKPIDLILPKQMFVPGEDVGSRKWEEEQLNNYVEAWYKTTGQMPAYKAILKEYSVDSIIRIAVYDATTEVDAERGLLNASGIAIRDKAVAVLGATSTNITGADRTDEKVNAFLGREDLRVMAIPDLAEIEGQGWFFVREVEGTALLQAGLNPDAIDNRESIALDMQKLMSQLTRRTVSINDLYALLPFNQIPADLRREINLTDPFAWIRYLLDKLLLQMPIQPYNAYKDLESRRKIMWSV